MSISKILQLHNLSARESLAKQLRSEIKQIQPSGKIKVAVLHNWGDFEISLRNETPNGDGIWKNVSFLPFSAVKSPDFVLVLNSIRQWRRVVRIAPERLWFATSEGPTAPYVEFHNGQGPASTIITSDDKKPPRSNGRVYIQAPPITPTWHVHKGYQELLNTDEIPKAKRLSWVTSNFAILKGHRRRLAFLQQLQNHVSFDLYGRGFAPLADKWDGLAPYRYSIAFENTIAPLYFTEKIMDCFVSHTLPLYYGSPDIAKFFPEKSMIQINPDDPNVFEKINEIANSNLWEERLPYILEAKHLVLTKYNTYARLSEWLTKAASIPATRPQYILLKKNIPKWELPE